MEKPIESLFSELPLRNITLPNRIVRSATYEGWGDKNGVPLEGLGECYSELAWGGVGTLITGFVYTTQAGRAMQPLQCGIEADDKIASWQGVVSQVRSVSSTVKLIMQLSHAGRQTRREITGQPVVGASTRRCSYFRQQVRELDDVAIRTIIGEFADAAYRAQEAGFDGIQIHAAHGYLIHQFLSPWTNIRTDRWAEPTLLLQEIVIAIREKCGDNFPILVKISAGEDTPVGLVVEDAIRTVKCLEALEIDAVEISYGTMEHAFNVIRGAMPIDAACKVNPMLKRLPDVMKWALKTFYFPSYRKTIMPFSEGYNLSAAQRIKRETILPVIPVGGFRSLESMLECVTTNGLDAVALCRPLICEPDLPKKLRQGIAKKSKCANCNLCTIYCDSSEPLRCHRKSR